VIAKGVELNAAGTDCQLMMETSGHGALKENRRGFDDFFVRLGLLRAGV
jgi:hypothetical protein